MEQHTTPPPYSQDHQQQQQQQKELKITKLPLPTASISLSLLSSHLLFLSTPNTPHLSPFARLKIPTQISSLSLSLSLSGHPYLKVPAKPKNIASHTPLLSPASLLRRLPADPSSGAAAARRCTLVWFRSDLRVHDHEPLSAAAAADSLSVLPVFLFDPQDYGRSASGFDKAGPRRAAFLLDSVADLRRALRARGSDLVVRVGRPEAALPELARAAGADTVYAHGEASRDEVAAEAAVAAAMEGEGLEVRWFWGSTLYHVDDLPFRVEDMPLKYGGFRERVKGVRVRDAIEAPDQIKGLPAQGDIEPGEIPTLLDLGLTPPATVTQDGKSVATAALKGGESEALERLKKCATEWHAQSPKEKNDSRDSIYGANFSSKISPWLALGCLSPRFVFEELKKTAARTISGSSTQKDGDATGDSGMNWFMFELLWRDFFRFVTKKSSSTERKLEGVPVTACAGSLV